MSQHPEPPRSSVVELRPGLPDPDATQRIPHPAERTRTGEPVEPPTVLDPAEMLRQLSTDVAAMVGAVQGASREVNGAARSIDNGLTHRLVEIPAVMGIWVAAAAICVALVWRLPASVWTDGPVPPPVIALVATVVCAYAATRRITRHHK